jgi:hypothetical protein
VPAVIVLVYQAAQDFVLDMPALPLHYFVGRSREIPGTRSGWRRVD